jgi:hypothetical protein
MEQIKKENLITSEHMILIFNKKEETINNTPLDFGKSIIRNIKTT